MNQYELWREGRILTSEEVTAIEARKEAAIQAARETPGTTTRRLRLSIDFSLTIAGTPPDDDGLNEPDPVYHARQARLLAAVKSHPAALQHWLHQLIANEMRRKDGAFWDQLVGGDLAYEEILAPALAALPEEDRRYFAEMSQQPFIYFDDLINLFSASFTMREEAPVIEEIACEERELYRPGSKNISLET